MQIRWQRAGRRPGIPLWAVLVIALWLGLVLAIVAMQQATGVGVVVCWFRAATGIPCPTCGSTRALMALAGGRPLEAIEHNPLVVAIGLVGAAWLAARIGLGRAVSVRLEPQERRWAWLLVAVLFFANWAYVIAWHLRHAPEVAG